MCSVSPNRWETFQKPEDTCHHRKSRKRSGESPPPGFPEQKVLFGNPRHWGDAMEANAPLGPGTPIKRPLCCAALTLELPLSSLVTSKPALHIKEATECRLWLQKRHKAVEAWHYSRWPAGPGPGKGRVPTDIPRETPKAGGFYWGKLPTYTHCQEGLDAGLRGPHRRAWAASSGLSVISWPLEAGPGRRGLAFKEPAQELKREKGRG